MPLLSFAVVVDAEAGAGDEVAHRAGDEYLARLCVDGEEAVSCRVMLDAAKAGELTGSAALCPARRRERLSGRERDGESPSDGLQVLSGHRELVW